MFSYILVSKHLRGGSIKRSEKFALCNRVIGKAKCLTPDPLPLIAKHVLYLLDHQHSSSIDNDSNVNHEELSSAWGLIESIVKSTSRISFSNSFVSDILRLAAYDIETVPTCQAALLLLLSYQQVHHIKNFQPLMNLFSTLIHSRLAHERRDTASLSAISSALCHTLIDLLPRIRDDQKPSVALKLALLLLDSSQFSDRAFSLSSHIFQDSQRFSQHFIHLLDSPRVSTIVPFVLTAAYNLELSAQFVTTRLVDIFILNLIDRTTEYRNDLSQTAISSLSRSLQAITAIFETTTSHKMLIFSNFQHASPFERPQVMPAKLQISHNTSAAVLQPIDALFCSVIELLSSVSKLQDGYAQVIPDVLDSITAIVRANINVADVQTKSVLSSCITLTSSHHFMSSVQVAIQKALISFLKSFSNSRNMASLFRNLGSLANESNFSSFKSVIRSPSVLNTLAQSLMDMPRGGASGCMSALISNTKFTRKENLECLSFLLCTIMECCAEKDKHSLIENLKRFVTQIMLQSSNLAEVRSCAIFILGSSLLIAARDGFSIVGEGIWSSIIGDLVAIICEDRQDAVLGVSFQNGQIHAKSRRRNSDEIKGVSNLLMALVECVRIEESPTEGFCLLRLLAIIVRLVLCQQKSLSQLFDGYVLDLLKLLQKQFEVLMDANDNIGLTVGMTDDNKTSIFINIGVIDDATNIMTSLSDVFDLLPKEEQENNAIVRMLAYCIEKWNGRHQLWAGFLERQFVRRSLERAVFKCLKKLKYKLKVNERQTGCNNRKCEACSILEFVVKIPGEFVSEDGTKRIVKELTSISKRLCCSRAGKVMVIASVLMSQNSEIYSSDQKAKILGEWSEGWSDLDVVENRIVMFQNMLKWGHAKDALLTELMDKVMSRAVEWTNACLNVINEDGYEYDLEQKWKAARIAVAVLKLDSECKAKAFWIGHKKRLDPWVKLMLHRLGWISLLEQSVLEDIKKQEFGQWWENISGKVQNASDMLNQLNMNTNSMNAQATQKTAKRQLELACFYLLITNLYDGYHLVLKQRFDVLQRVVQIAINVALTDENGHSQETLKIAALCSQCCETVLLLCVSSRQPLQGWESVSFGLSSLISTVLRSSDVSGGQLEINEVDNDAIFLMKNIASCVIFMLKHQCATHRRRWEMVSLICMTISCARHVCKTRSLAEPCGQLVAKLLATVEWCHEQGQMTIEVVKTIFLSCAQILCGLTLSRFEAPVIVALASLSQSLPRDVISTIIASAPAALTVVIRNIDQLARHSSYEGQ